MGLFDKVKSIFQEKIDKHAETEHNPVIDAFLDKVSSDKENETNPQPAETQPSSEEPPTHKDKHEHATDDSVPEFSGQWEMPPSDKYQALLNRVSGHTSKIEDSNIGDEHGNGDDEAVQENGEEDQTSTPSSDETTTPTPTPSEDVIVLGKATPVATAAPAAENKGGNSEANVLPAPNTDEKDTPSEPVRVDTASEKPLSNESEPDTFDEHDSGPASSFASEETATTSDDENGPETFSSEDESDTDEHDSAFRPVVLDLGGDILSKDPFSEENTALPEDTDIEISESVTETSKTEDQTGKSRGIPSIDSSSSPVYTDPFLERVSGTENVNDDFVESVDVEARHLDK